MFDRMLVVASPGLPALRGYARLAAHLARHAPGACVTPVLSMARPDARLTPREVEAALQTRPCVLPWSAGAARAAIEGRPLVETEARGGYARAVRDLAAGLKTTVAAAPRPEPAAGRFAVGLPALARRLAGLAR